MKTLIVNLSKWPNVTTQRGEGKGEDERENKMGQLEDENPPQNLFIICKNGTTRSRG